MATIGDRVSSVKESGKETIDRLTNRIPGSLREGEFTKAVERQTAKVPSFAFLTLALGSIVLSASIAAISERKEWANFVGQWVSTFLLLGIYNKLVKLEGSDFSERYAKRKAA